MKKNLGKERMEKLRKNLSTAISDTESLNDDCVSILSSAIHKQSKYCNILSHIMTQILFYDLIFGMFVLGRYTNICKNAEVRLTRLKDKLSKDATFSNKEDSSSLQNKKCKEPEKPLESVSGVTVVELVSRSNRDSLYEEMDWEPMEDEKISFEVILINH